MAPNEGNERPCAINSTPPPQDPFVTYQTPYPRREASEKNPFVEFRRAADHMFGSFFGGLTRSFGIEQESHERRPHQNTSIFEGFQKQVDKLKEIDKQVAELFYGDANTVIAAVENEMKSLLDRTPERRQELPAPQNDDLDRLLGQELRRLEAELRETTTRIAPQCSQFEDGELPIDQQTAASCPALNGELSGTPEGTELDAYMHMLKQSDKEQVWKNNSPFASSKKGKMPSGWFSGVGWDGKQKQKYQECFRKYSEENVHKLDPFEAPSDTMPWLMLSPYSPIYLCNSLQPRMYEVKLQTKPDAPFRVVDPHYHDRASPEHERLQKVLPWADAFEDLLSLSHTGHINDRNYSTWGTPKTWFHDIVYRGSLGPSWGFNDEGHLTRKALGAKEQCRWYRQRDQALIEANDNSVLAYQSTDPTEAASAAGLLCSRPWTPVEDHNLMMVTMNDKNIVEGWEEVATYFPDRSAEACRERTQTLLNDEEPTTPTSTAGPYWTSPLDIIAAVEATRYSGDCTAESDVDECATSSPESHIYESVWSKSSDTRSTNPLDVSMVKSSPAKQDDDTIVSQKTNEHRFIRADGRVEIRNFIETEFSNRTRQRTETWVIPGTQHPDGVEEPAIGSGSSTTTRSKLSDGRYETRTVTKSRWSDGAETFVDETSYSTPSHFGILGKEENEFFSRLGEEEEEHEYWSSPSSQVPESVITEQANRTSKTATPVQDAIKAEKTKSGWFWK